jgi:pimeloyl-ACP methyl ester carboxylesterase
MSKLLTEFVDLGDLRMAYCQHGGGPALILLHGNSESKAIFNKYQTEHFPTFKTYALDSRGHGESKSKDKKLSIGQISDDVIKFCQAQSIKEAVVIGYSDGGNIALFLAKKAPQLFKKLVAISPNTLVSGTTDDSLRLFKRIIKVMTFLSKLGFNFEKYLMTFDLMMHDIGLSDDDLKSIKTKVKIIYAEKDMIKEDHIKDIAAAIPGCELEKVMGCTHMSIINNLQAIKVMQDYLAESK